MSHLNVILDAAAMLFVIFFFIGLGFPVLATCGSSGPMNLLWQGRIRTEYHIISCRPSRGESDMAVREYVRLCDQSFA